MGEIRSKTCKGVGITWTAMHSSCWLALAWLHARPSVIICAPPMRRISSPTALNTCGAMAGRHLWLRLSLLRAVVRDRPLVYSRWFAPGGIRVGFVPLVEAPSGR